MKNRGVIKNRLQVLMHEKCLVRKKIVNISSLRLKYKTIPCVMVVFTFLLKFIVLERQACVPDVFHTRRETSKL